MATFGYFWLFLQEHQSVKKKIILVGAAKITPPPINEQIYAPVAHLQQKIQQRHQGLNGKEIPNYQSRQSPQSPQSC